MGSESCLTPTLHVLGACGCNVPRSIFAHERAAIFRGNALDVSKILRPNSIDAIVTDPPYGLGFMGKAWDHEVPGVDFWREFLVVAKPGAHLIAFGGTRKYHRMTCAIEDAGWEIRDVLSWLYGSGFPKSLNIGDGRGTALKPAWEPIILARKPIVGTVAANVQAHGTGGMNIDACRVGSAGGTRSAADAAPNYKNEVYGRGMGGLRAETPEGLGRWPANLVLDEAAATMLDEQSGERKSGNAITCASAALGIMNDDAWQPKPRSTVARADTGGASRFFYVAKAPRSEKDAGLGHLAPRTGGEATDRKDGTAGLENPRSGAGRTGGARNYHPTVKPIALMRWLCRLITPHGGTILDPFAGSGSTMVAALAEGFSTIGIELGGENGEYLPIIEGRVKHALGI